MSISYCDNCHAPMVNAVHHRAEVCPHGDTDQCMVCCAGLADDIDALIARVEAK